MENIIIVLLTSTNYFQWKSHMEDLLRSKGIYIITLGINIAPDDDEKKHKWEKNDQARGLIEMSIFSDLKFHLEAEDSPIKSWEKLLYENRGLEFKYFFLLVTLL
jgi:hypothetical protein